MKTNTMAAVYKWEKLWLPLVAFVCSAGAYTLWGQTPPPLTSLTPLKQSASSSYIAVNLSPRQNVRFPDMSLPEKSPQAIAYQPYKRPSTQAKPKKKPNTLAFIGHIGRELILDEVETFARRATLIVETHEHMQEYLEE